MTPLIEQSAVFSIAGTEFAFGLEWIAANRSPTTIRVLRQQAIARQATHWAWRPALHQVGLARIAGGQTPSLFRPWRSAASIFADLPQPPAEPHALIAAFSFQSGEVWVVAANQGRLFADGDRLFLDMTSAQTHFRHLYDRVHRWGTIIAPADWGYHRALQDGPLAYFAGRQALRPDPGSRRGSRLAFSARPGVPLRTLQSGRYLVGKAAVIGGVFSLAAGGLWLHRHKTALEPLPVVEAVSPFYPDVTQSMAVLAACEQRITDGLLRSMAPGWDVEDILCDHHSVAITLRARPFTPLSTLATYQPFATLDSRTRTAVIANRFQAELPSQKLGLPLPNTEQLLASFGQIDEQTQAMNSFSVPSPASEPAPQAMGVPRPRPYRQMTWTLQTRAAPTAWRMALAAIPAIDIDAVALKRTETGIAWTLKGVAYVAP